MKIGKISSFFVLGKSQYLSHKSSATFFVELAATKATKSPGTVSSRDTLPDLHHLQSQFHLGLGTEFNKSSTLSFFGG